MRLLAQNAAASNSQQENEGKERLESHLFGEKMKNSENKNYNNNNNFSLFFKRCVLAPLYEGLSVPPSKCPLAHRQNRRIPPKIAGKHCGSLLNSHLLQTHLFARVGLLFCPFIRPLVAEAMRSRLRPCVCFLS